MLFFCDSHIKTVLNTLHLSQTYVYIFCSFFSQTHFSVSLNFLLPSPPFFFSLWKLDDQPKSFKDKSLDFTHLWNKIYRPHQLSQFIFELFPNDFPLLSCLSRKTRMQSMLFPNICFLSFTLLARPFQSSVTMWTYKLSSHCL